MCCCIRQHKTSCAQTRTLSPRGEKRPSARGRLYAVERPAPGRPVPLFRPGYPLGGCLKEDPSSCANTLRCKLGQEWEGAELESLQFQCEVISAPIHATPLYYRLTLMKQLTVLELCAGAGGQALGLEQAGYQHAALLEIDKHACNTLRLNRPHWNVIEGDLRAFDGRQFRGVDLVAAGLPCPPFSIAGKQLGEEDERNLFPSAIRVISQVKPRAVMIENVRGILDAVFDDYRNGIAKQLRRLGYKTEWQLVNASDFGVPQLRPRVVFVAVRADLHADFSRPAQDFCLAPTVGQVLFEMISANGWKGADAWRDRANEIAPTIVGGSLKHGGPDLGPTRAKKAWASLGVDGHGIADRPPDKNFIGMPKLTVPMVARLQGFPAHWQFVGGKTAAYRQVGNAFPPPVARAVAKGIHRSLQHSLPIALVAG
jgi:DNA (cytosine-5)-methyltransferase 1